MAEVIRTEEREGRTILIYASGLEKDSSTGYIVRPADGVQITKENSSAFHRRRREIRAAVALEAANNAVNRQELVQEFGDMAFVAAITESAMLKAQNPKDLKSIEASRFVMEVTGLNSSGDFGADPSTDHSKSRVLLLLAALAERDAPADVIEGDISE